MCLRQGERGLFLCVQCPRWPEQRWVTDFLDLEVQLPSGTWSRALCQRSRSYLLLSCIPALELIFKAILFLHEMFGDVYLLSVIILVHYNYVKTCFKYLRLNLHFHHYFNLLVIQHFFSQWSDLWSCRDACQFKRQVSFPLSLSPLHPLLSVSVIFDSVKPGTFLLEWSFPPTLSLFFSNTN